MDTPRPGNSVGTSTDFGITIEQRDALAAAATTGAKLAAQEGINRVSLLTVHGIYTVLIGVSILAVPQQAFLGPSFDHLPMSWLAGLSIASGAILIVSAWTGRRRCQQLGLLGVGAFALAMAVGLGVSYLAWSGTHPPTVYPVFVYMHLGTIMLVHLWTIHRQNRWVHRG